VFDVKTNAEVRNINVRAENHGDDHVPAIDVKLMLLDVPIAKISSAIPDFEQRFYDGDQPILQEIVPFQIQHKIENVEAKIGRVVLKGADIKKGSKFWHKPSKVANVLITVQCSDFSEAAVPALMKMLKEEAKVEIIECQLKIPEMEQ
jgi:hypothetical protein